MEDKGAGSETGKRDITVLTAQTGSTDDRGVPVYPSYISVDRNTVFPYNGTQNVGYPASSPCTMGFVSAKNRKTGRCGEMDEAQEKYITSTHDITTVSVIPVTCVHEEPLGAVLEVLSRETAENVIPAYYETALKTKYIRDDQSAQMLDILRQNISCVFPVAFGGYCNNFPLNSVFYTLLKSKNTDFVSTYVSLEKAAQAKLDELWNAFSAEEETK